MKFIRKHPMTSLLVLAFVSGILWRLELEYHGWAGLIWTSYFHYAVPIGFVLFLLWGNALFDLPQKKRIQLNVVALLFGIVMHWELKDALLTVFNPMSVGVLMIYGEDSKGMFYFLLFLPVILIFLLPTGVYFILRIFKLRPPSRSLLYSVLGVTLSVPLSLWLLDIMDHVGGADLVHVVKSGIIIPFWVFSLGLLLLGAKDKKVVDKIQP